MDDLVFCSQRNGEPLEYDAEGEYAIIEQFQERWFVRVGQDDVRPYVKVGTETLELVWSPRFGGYVLPADKYDEELKKLRKQVDGSAGLIWLFTYLPTGVERLLTPPLYVGPGSLTEVEFSAILDRLGQISVSLEGVALGPVMSPQQIESGSSLNRPITITDRLITRAEGFLRLYSALASNWDLIRKVPARQMALVMALVDSSRPDSISSSRALQRSIQRPDLRRHEIPVPKVTDDTPENRFLRFVLKSEVHDKAIPLARLLRIRAKWLRSDDSRPLQDFGLGYVNLWQQRREMTEQTARHLNELAKEIESAGKQSSDWLKESFLTHPSGPVVDPHLLTPRLTNSKEYGPIYRAFVEYSLGRTTSSSGAEGNWLWALQERLIHPSWQLYELWTFIETYTMLVERFGFQPIGDTPMKRIRLVGDSAALEKGEQFELEFLPVNSQDAAHCHVRMTVSYVPTLTPRRCDTGKRCFDPKVCPSLLCYKMIMIDGHWIRNGLTPDMTMELRSSYEETPCRFVMDAKYHRYSQQKNHYLDERRKYALESVFDLELLGYAKMKYLDGLSSTAAFIVHSDPDPDYTTFGDSSFAILPVRERGFGSVEWWPGHRVGAIYASPWQLMYLERLLKCFLMYHAGIEDVCWNCRKVLTKENGGRTWQPDTQGDYYQCPDCGRFWIGQVCQNRYEHHRLIKMGRESFHKTLPGKDWQCVCPVCGDAPSWQTPPPVGKASVTLDPQARQFPRLR
jgi:hypothetical protein